MTDLSQGRSNVPVGGSQRPSTSTFSGSKGLEFYEPLIFEMDHAGRTGVDFADVEVPVDRLNGQRREDPVGLPGLSEPQVVRHYTRLSQKNYGIDSGFYPLGSCTMKHNPRLNEKLARLPGLGDLHPMQPMNTVQGALELIDNLAMWLKTLCGMPAIAMSPAAGAHGELCGMMAIKAAIEARGEGATRTRVLVPESAHGTNPASAAACGFSVDSIPANDRGRVDLDAFKAKLGDDVAGIMLTNPNTCGLFENDILKIADAIHEAGATFTAMEPTSTPSWGGCVRAIWVLIACTSICTKPFPPHTVAADRGRDLWCCPKPWLHLHRCRTLSTVMTGLK